MRWGKASWGVLLALVLLVPTGPAWSQGAEFECLNALPEVLKVGIPFRTFTAVRSLSDFERQVRRALEPHLWPSGDGQGEDPCAGRRRAQIDISFGTDYEILDWLSQGEVDGAVVSALGLWLLTTDGTDLVDVTPAEREDRPGTAEAPKGEEAEARLGQPDGNATARFAVLGRGDPGGQLSPREILEEHRSQLLCRALAARPEVSERFPSLESGCPTRQRLEEWRREEEKKERSGDPLCRPGELFGTPYRSVFPDHFSATGFILPLSAQSHWLEGRLQGLGGSVAGRQERELLRDVRQAFWTAWFCDARFTLDHDPFDRLDPTPGSSAARPLSLRDGDTPEDDGGSGTRRPGPRAKPVEILFGGRPSAEPGLTEVTPATGTVAGDRWVLQRALVREEEARDDAEARADLLPAHFYRLLTERRGDAIEPRWLLPEEQDREPEPLLRVLVRKLRGAEKDEEARPGEETAREILPPMPLPLSSLLLINPRFGVRSMAFTVDETLRLLRAQELSHDRQPNLSLVLPGGGVKSAYQAVLLDELYSTGSLRNVLVRDSGPQPRRARTMAAGAAASAVPPAGPLAVHSVIGTSGGALTGYFVAQLGEKGPFNLAQILWNQGSDDGETCAEAAEPGPPLTSNKIFGFTDLARYVSLVVSFLIFCTGLTIVAVRQRREHQPVWGKKSPRYRMRVCLGAILVGTPILVQITSVIRYREHVPEIEGVLYMVLVLVVMMADQCVIDTDGDDGHPAAISWQLPLVTGALLVAVPVLGRFVLYLQQNLSGDVVSQTAEDLAELLLGGPATLGVTYFLISLLVVFGGLIIPLRRKRPSPWLRERLWPFGLIAEYLFFSALALFLLAIPGVQRAGKDVPLLVWGLLLPALLWLMFRYLHREKGKPSRHWWTLYYLGLWLACLLTLILCQPVRGLKRGLVGFLIEPAGLEVSGGPLMLVTGALVLAIGVVLWICHEKSCYRFRSLGRFMNGLIVAIGHSVAVFATVLILEKLFPSFIPSLELDGRYWLVIGVVAVALTFAILFLAHRSEPGDRLGFLAEGVSFLTGSHPNRPFITVRFVRMAIVAVLAVTWWNFLLAPALYGNKLARSTLSSTIQRFEAQWLCAHEGRLPVRGSDEDEEDEEEVEPPFTAPFVSPANELAEDGTRFFLFIPAGDVDCPEVPERARSGSRWLTYGVVDRKTSLSNVPRGSRCEPMFERGLLKQVIFASGSPFPIFAPHRVQAQIGDREEMVLIDGGYTNNVPVEAAQTMEARQALVLRSEHPSPVEEPAGRAGRFLGRLVSPLVRNLGRLPAFLFQRSQQVDRLSSQDLFVVSLAPLAEYQDWPELYHFQGSVIESLKRTAGDDLARRIGFVESWGRPEPRLSLPVNESEIRRPAAAPGGASRKPPEGRLAAEAAEKRRLEEAARKALQPRT